MINMKAADNLYTALTRPGMNWGFEGSHNIRTPRPLVNEILNQIDLQDKTILALFNVEWVFSLIYEHGIEPDKITFYSDHTTKTEIAQALKVEVISNFMTNRKFDIIVGNPPYNKAAVSTKTIAGTSGNTTLYKKFIDLSFSLRNDLGIVALITQRNGISHAIKKYNVSTLNVDTSEYWKFNAGYFISSGKDSSMTDVTNDSILRKIYSIRCTRPFRHAIPGNYESHKKQGKFSELKVPNSVYGLVDRTKSDSPCKYEWIVGSHTPSGPKLIFPALDSLHGYEVTDLPSYAPSTCTLFFETIDQATSARNFVKNNPTLKYLTKKLGEKSKGLVFRYLKDFDLSQITSGYEYPKEWNLTPEEISLIEESVK